MTIEDVPGHYITMKTSPKPIFRRIGQSFVHKFHASSNLDSLIFMLASLNEAGIKGTALVGIDKRSGQTVHRIPIFSKPNYEIDPFGGWIFVMDARTIRAHAL